jgi:N-acyl-L-homoserine lactone synthetase
MGQAPKIIEEIRRTRKQVLEDERQWKLNPETGELEAEELPGEDAQARPQPVQVPRQTTD